jgi:hypothetical protein
MKTIIRDTVLKPRLAMGLRTTLVLLSVLSIFSSALAQQGISDRPAMKPGRKHPASKPLPPGMQKSMTAGTITTTFGAVLKTDGNGCYWEVAYKWECPNQSAQYYDYNLPHGIQLTVSGATIRYIGTLGNSNSPVDPTITGHGWGSVPIPEFSSSPYSAWSIPAANSTAVKWVQQPTTGANPYEHHACGTAQNYDLGIISEATFVTARVYVTPTFGFVQHIEMVDLDGSGIPMYFGEAFGPPIPTPVPASPCICSETATVIHLDADPQTSTIEPVPAPTTILWYKYPLTACGDVCPPPPITIPPPAPWVLVNTSAVPAIGANECPTNTLDVSTCYIALLENPCFSYYSNIGHVKVTQPIVGAIVVTPEAGQDALTATNHICNQWTGSLAFAPDKCCLVHPFTANNPVTWTESINGGSPSPVPAAYVTDLSLVGPSSFSAECCKTFTYTASTANSCGAYSTSFTVIVDRALQSINAANSDVVLGASVWTDPVTPPTASSPFGPICDSQSVIISAAPKCSGDPCEGIKILDWLEYSSWTDPNVTPPLPTPGNLNGWVQIPGASGTPYFTNKLGNPSTNCNIKSKWYCVGISNGACPKIYSYPYEIQVKPPLSVTVKEVGDCIPNIVLKAKACYTPVTYQWYLDGQLIPATTANVSVGQPGYYYVVVTDAACNVSAKSKPILVCGPPVVKISGPCGICKGSSIELKAIQALDPYGCNTDCEYLWTGSATFGGSSSGATITVTSPGTYSVTVKCGPCSTKVTHLVEACPPIVACECREWSTGVVSLSNAASVVTTFPCGGGGAIDAGIYTITTPTFICNPSSCPPTYTWTVTGTALGSGGPSTSNSFNFNFSAQGIYNVTVTPLCGTKKCNPCTLKITVKECTCKKDGKLTVMRPAVAKTSKITDPNICNDTVSVANGSNTVVANYTCVTCATIYKWEFLTSPVGSPIITNTSGTFSYNYLIPGDYKVRVIAMCGGRACDTCIFVFRVGPWEMLITDGVLESENDPVNVELENARQKFASTPFGKSIEKWYAELKAKDAIPTMLTKHFADVRTMLSISRKLIQKRGTMEKKDIVAIEGVLKMMDKEIAPAPIGLIDEAIKRLDSAVGQDWSAIKEILSK